MVGTLKRFLAVNMISQADVARGIGRTRAFVSQLANEETGASQETVRALLTFLSERVGRPVQYEELFAPTPAAVPMVAPSPEAA